MTVPGAERGGQGGGFRPSGEQLELRSGAAVAVIVEVGGGLRRFDVDGVPVVDGYAEDQMASAGRGQVLLPWPNRVADGRWEWQGTSQQLAITEVSKHTANHGLVRWAGWQLEREDEATGVARHVLHPQSGFPFRLAATIRYRVFERGLQVETAVENRSDRPAPVGLGFHPYLATGSTPVDACSLLVPAATRLDVDERGIPTGRGPVQGTDYDFRTPRVVGGQVLDTPYTDLARDGGLARIVLDGPSGRTTLWMDDAFGFTQVFTGDTVPQTERRRHGVAVEPMTCPANALVTGEGLVVLEPGGVLSGTWGIDRG